MAHAMFNKTINLMDTKEVPFTLNQAIAKAAEPLAPQQRKSDEVMSWTREALTAVMIQLGTGALTKESLAGFIAAMENARQQGKHDNIHDGNGIPAILKLWREAVRACNGQGRALQVLWALFTKARGEWEGWKSPHSPSHPWADPYLQAYDAKGLQPQEAPIAPAPQEFDMEEYLWSSGGCTPPRDHSPPAGDPDFSPVDDYLDRGEGFDKELTCPLQASPQGASVPSSPKTKAPPSPVKRGKENDEEENDDASDIFKQLQQCAKMRRVAVDCMKTDCGEMKLTHETVRRSLNESKQLLAVTLENIQRLEKLAEKIPSPMQTAEQAASPPVYF